MWKGLRMNETAPLKGRRRCQDESDQQDTARRDSRIVASYHVFRYRPFRVPYTHTLLVSGRFKYINQATIIDTLVTRGPWSSSPRAPNQPDLSELSMSPRLSIQALATLLGSWRSRWRKEPGRRHTYGLNTCPASLAHRRTSNRD